MLSLTSRFRKNESGATATEYAMLIVFVALAIAVGAQAMGTSLATLFQGVATAITASTTAIPTP